MASAPIGRLAIRGIAVALVAAAAAPYLHTQVRLAESAANANDSTLVSSRFDRARALGSLVRDPLDQRALADLMIGERAQGQVRAAARAQAVLGRMSRRSRAYLKAELDEAVALQSLERLVAVLDKLATLEPGRYQTILPVLVQALDEPGGAEMLAARQSRPWYASMIATGARDPERLEGVAAYLLNHRPPQADLRDQFLKSVIQGFLARGDVGGAQAFFTDFGQFKGIDWSALGWDRPVKAAADLSLFWRFPNPQAELVRIGNGASQLVAENLSEPAPLAERSIVVQPGGTYQVVAELEGASPRDDLLIYWRVRCGKVPIRQASRVEIDESSKWAAVKIAFEANAACKGYTLYLYGEGQAGSAQGRTIRISSPKLSRI